MGKSDFFFRFIFGPSKVGWILVGVVGRGDILICHGQPLFKTNIRLCLFVLVSTACHNKIWLPNNHTQQAFFKETKFVKSLTFEVYLCDSHLANTHI